MSGFLDSIYDGARSPEDTRRLYDAWAESYEAEVGAEGYATPPRVAAGLRRCGADTGRPVLDFGSGTGLSGLALRAAGFTLIDGLDLSARMPEAARAKNVYRNLAVLEPDQPLPFADGAYDVIAAIGVIGPGAAPISLLPTLFAKLAPGQLLAFSFNDHALADPGHEAAVEAQIRARAGRLLYKEYGPHLPGRNMNSNVYVLERT